MLILDSIHYVDEDFLTKEFFWFLYLYIHYTYYVYNNKKFSFLAFVISIVKQILLILIVTLAIYLVNIQNFLTINDDKSLQYICAFIGIIVISLTYVKRIKKDGLQKTLVKGFLLISSLYLLRLNLIFCIPLVLPLTLNQLAVNILTTRLNLITYIAEDIFNLEFWSSVKSIWLDSYSAIQEYCFPVLYCDDTGRSSVHPSVYDWIVKRQNEVEFHPVDINIQAMNLLDYFGATWDSLNFHRLSQIQFNKTELQLLNHVKCIQGLGDYYVTVCPKGKEIYPVKFHSLFWDLIEGKPDIVPFPNCQEYNIPLYKLNTAESIIDSKPNHLVLEHIFLKNIEDERAIEKVEMHMESSIDVYSLQGYYSPTFITDWDLNSRIYLKFKYRNHNQYAPYHPNLLNTQVEFEFCIKVEDFKYIPLGVRLASRPCQIWDVGYNKPKSLNTDYFLSAKKFQEERLKSEMSVSDAKKKKVLKEEVKDLKRWDGTNDPKFDISLIQSSKLYKSPILSAEDMKIVLSWKRSA